MGQTKHANKQAEGKTRETYRQRDPYFILLVSKQLPSGQGLFPVPVPSVLGLPEPSATASHALSLCLSTDIDCRWDCRWRELLSLQRQPTDPKWQEGASWCFCAPGGPCTWECTCRNANRSWLCGDTAWDRANMNAISQTPSFKDENSEDEKHSGLGCQLGATWESLVLNFLALS